MAKLALINRDLKRARTVAKFAEKRAALKAVINDATRSIEERMEVVNNCNCCLATPIRAACAIVAV